MTTRPVTIRTHSPTETVARGRQLGTWARPGDVVALVGSLGAGKTMLVKGMAAGLGVMDDREVQSPTYVLVREYSGRLPIFHLDLYRLPDGIALSALGFDEMCDAGGVVIVEWADRARQAMPPTTVWIEMTAPEATVRDITIRIPNDRDDPWPAVA